MDVLSVAPISSFCASVLACSHLSFIRRVYSTYSHKMNCHAVCHRVVGRWSICSPQQVIPLDFFLVTVHVLVCSCLLIPCWAWRTSQPIYDQLSDVRITSVFLGFITGWFFSRFSRRRKGEELQRNRKGTRNSKRKRVSKRKRHIEKQTTQKVN